MTEQRARQTGAVIGEIARGSGDQGASAHHPNSDGVVLCQLVLTETALKDGFALKLAPGCDASVARLGFTQWRLDREELVLVPARGAPWRFESLDEKTWGQLPESDNRVTLVRR